MKGTTTFAQRWAFVGTLVVFLVWLLALPRNVVAQSAGNNTVYSSTTTVTGSSSFIDASVFASTSTDICATIRGILNTAPLAGTVIDARGINSSNSKMVCAAGTSPWSSGVSNYVNVPSYLLLPAGTITIPETWLLPDRTRLVGEAASSGGSGGTVIQACTSSICGSNFSTGTPMITLGDSTDCNSICFGISVEQLTLNGSGLSITGIHNEMSEELTYVDHVTLYQIMGIGLEVVTLSGGGSGAGNSGPYSNIKFDTGALIPNTGTECVVINGPGTRGIHGLTCLSNGTPNTAILLDGSDNTLEDIHIDGFNEDGILVGSQANSFSNMIFNVTGGNCGGSCSMKNVVHVDNAKQVYQLSISQVTKAGAINAIEDDQSLTSTTPVTDSMVAMYILGQPLAGGYSRFTTSLNLPTWLIGSSAIVGTPTCLANGSLYSKTAGTTGTTLWACVAGNWVAVK
jgi:hypothetical protein